MHLVVFLVFSVSNQWYTYTLTVIIYHQHAPPPKKHTHIHVHVLSHTLHVQSMHVQYLRILSTHKHACTHTHTHTHTHLHAHTHTLMHTHTHGRMHAHTHARTTHTHNTHTHKHIHTYTHTKNHTHTCKMYTYAGRDFRAFSRASKIARFFRLQTKQQWGTSHTTHVSVHIHSSSRHAGPL